MRKGFGPSRRRLDRGRRVVVRSQSKPARNPQRYASRGPRSHRPEWYGPLVPEIPCGRVCRLLSASMLRYLAGSRGRSTARSPSPGIGPSKRILYSARHLDNASHISETRTLAGDPRVERKQFGQHSPLIVGNRSGGVGTHGIPPDKLFKSKNPLFLLTN